MEKLAERLPTLQKPEIDKELRIATDTATWLAETLHGSMRTSFEFSFDGQEIRGEDGGSLDEIFDDSISEAKAMVEWNPSLLFELRRRLIEREELDDMYRMARGELPNTMVVISDFPDELKDSKEDVGGYNVKRQQTMMRVITVEEDGKIRITSQSLDRSNRKALEAIYAGMGEPVQPGEMLAQRIHRHLSPAHREKLAGNLTQVHDDSLRDQFGGEWHAGISQQPDHNVANTYDFVLAQHDLMSWFTKEKLADPVGAEKFRYKLAATTKARHDRYLKQLQANDPALGSVSPSSFATIENIARNLPLDQELEREGARAAKKGDVFSGCGDTVDADEDPFSMESQLEGLGYRRGRRGNRNSMETDDSDDLGSRKFTCDHGHENRRPKRNETIDKCQHQGCTAKVACK